ncbi:MAG: hypothetical protein CM15mP107_2340 [Bacteroidota bacterium]|nr:MAG: hypothetical protein CM15mP107_2340 [Bacteroidota bacterium]
MEIMEPIPFTQDLISAYLSGENKMHDAESFVNKS